nr:unnamed protein product [Callosobruchus chinensis]
MHFQQTGEIKDENICTSRYSHIPLSKCGSLGVQPEGVFRVSNKPDDLVLRLIQPISGTRRNVTLDTWFTSYNQMMKLLQGTIRKNKREIPIPLLKVRNREVNNSEYHSGCIYAKEDYNFIFFSTLHRNNAIDIDTGDKRKQEVVTFYNLTKGGLDSLDKLSANYNVSRNSRRWTLTIFYFC